MVRGAGGRTTLPFGGAAAVAPFAAVGELPALTVVAGVGPLPQALFVLALFVASGLLVGCGAGYLRGWTAGVPREQLADAVRRLPEYDDDGGAALERDLRRRSLLAATPVPLLCGLLAACAALGPAALVPWGGAAGAALCGGFLSGYAVGVAGGRDAGRTYDLGTLAEVHRERKRGVDPEAWGAD